MKQPSKRSPGGRGSIVLVAVTLALGGGIVAWKYAAAAETAGAAALPEPAAVVRSAVAEPREHHGTATAIGTVVATRSVTLRNEVPGTVRRTQLTPGRIVEPGTVLVALDVSVEEAELKALEARAELASSTLARLQRLAERRAVSAMDVDNARAERDMARAEIERIRAVIERRTIRAPFRARVGIADVHPGQFLEAGTFLTTLQGVDDAVHVDFAVAQSVAAQLAAGDAVEVFVSEGDAPIPARIVAVDARVDPATRNATVRARIEHLDARVSPGASVRVQVPVGAPQSVVVVPVTALRKGPGGDHVFLIEDASGQTRARVREVRAGPLLGEEVVILGGLEPGDRVASAGSFKLMDGMLVSVAPESGRSAAVHDSADASAEGAGAS